jgi:hypothetical protein
VRMIVSRVIEAISLEFAFSLRQLGEVISTPGKR